MKKEWEKRLNEMYDFFANYGEITGGDIDETQKYRDDAFLANMEKLAATKDTEVLEHLMDFFDEKFDREVNGICEILSAMIEFSFTLDQRIEVFYKKFDTLAGNYPEMCSQMSTWYLRSECFDEFRKMFNAVKSQHSSKILEKLKNWVKHGRSHEKQNMVCLLEEDMEKW
jgi:hypothetical protein